MKGTLFLTFFVCGLIGSLMGQNGKDALFLKAKKVYDEHNYREALYHLKKFIAVDSSNAEAFKMRGNCYLEFNQLDSAEVDYYFALKLDTTLSEVNYNLGLLYESRTQTDSAIIFYDRFLAVNPNDLDVYLRLGSIYDEKMVNDSSRFFYEKAFALDSLNPEPYYQLAWSYYLTEDWDVAIDWATRGKKLEANNTGFFIVSGLSYYARKAFSQSVDEFEKALEIEDQPSIYVLKARSEVFMHTDTMLLQETEDLSYQFTEIKSRWIGSLDQWVRDSTHLYSYEKLLDKFNSDDQNFGIDQYFMFYFGSSSTEEYSPYSLKDTSMPTLLKEGKYVEAVEIGEKIALKNPTDFKNYGLLSVAYLNLGQMDEFYENVLKYEGFVNGILATGNGESFSEALIVVNPSDEYEVINYLGHSSEGQSLDFDKGHTFDILSTVDEYGTEKEFYFNIDKSYKLLIETLGDGKKRKKRGKKKRKSKRATH